MKSLVHAATSYTDVFLVNLVDEAVTDDPHGLIAPQAQEQLWSGEAVRRGETQTIVDARQVTQVEDVVELGGGGWQVFHCCAVNREVYSNAW